MKGWELNREVYIKCQFKKNMPGNSLKIGSPKVEPVYLRLRFVFCMGFLVVRMFFTDWILVQMPVCVLF